MSGDKKSDAADLVQRGIANFGLQVGFAALSFGSALLLSRILGAAGYGAFASAVAWSNIVIVLATLGFGNLLIREAATARTDSCWSALAGLQRFALWMVGGGALLLALTWGTGLALLWPQAVAPGALATYLIAALLVPLGAWIATAQALLRGFDHLVRSRIPELLVRPGLLFSSLALVYFVLPIPLSAAEAMAINVGAAALAGLLGLVWVLRARPPALRLATPDFGRRQVWISATIPLYIASLSQVVLANADIALLGVLSDMDAAGRYAAASRMVYVIGFAATSVDLVLSSAVARRYAQGDTAGVEQVANRVTLAAFLLVLPMALGMGVWGGELLAIFGKEFSSAAMILTILLLGRVVDLALGPSPMVLMMTRHERAAAVLVTSAALVALLGQWIVIPLYGAEGAAWVALVCIVLPKLLGSVVVRRRLGIRLGVLRGATHVLASTSKGGLV